MIPRASRRLWTGLVGFFVLLAILLLAEAWRGGILWRSAYPHLPRQVQALPYRLRARIPHQKREPVALPTPALLSSSPKLSLPSTLTPALAPVVPLNATRAVDSREDPESGRPLAATAEATDPGLPSHIMLEGVAQQYQTWNNCGPATISMLLGYFGNEVDQRGAAVHLKPDPDDKNVGPEELASWARSQGFRADVYRAGSIDEARALLASGFPLLVETWFVPEPGDEMGHYRLLLGYEDEAQEDPQAGADSSQTSNEVSAGATTPALRSGHFLAADSYLGPRLVLPYAEFDAEWRVFGRIFVLVRPADDLPPNAEPSPFLPELGDDAYRAARAFEQASAEVAGIGDAFAWFNLGQSLLDLGDSSGAAGAFDRAREIGLPWRMLWYQFGPFEAYAAQGRWEDVRSLAEANLSNAANLEESHYWLGRAHLAAGRRDQAAAAFRRSLQLNPGFAPANEALSALEAG